MWLELAAALHSTKAQYGLGLLYYFGKGVRQDKEKAKEYFGQACDNGYQKGCDAYRNLNEEGV
jgi:TPR repeat protein